MRKYEYLYDGMMPLLCVLTSVKRCYGSIQAQMITYNIVIPKLRVFCSYEHRHDLGLPHCYSSKNTYE